MATYAVQTNGPVSLSAATDTTLIQIHANTGTAVVIGFGVSFNGVTAAAVPVKVDLLRQTTAGTGTTTTPLKLDTTDGASGKVATRIYTVEPTASDIIRSWYVTPIGGLLTVSFSTDEEIYLANTERLGLRVNAPATVSCLGHILWTE